MDKHWIVAAVEYLAQSLEPVPHEINEIDWKGGLSPEKNRLAEHLIAFANHPNGGCLAYGIRDVDAALVGVEQDDVARIVNMLANLGRDAIEPALAIDHAVVDYRGASVLLVCIPEQATKPVHRRGKSIEES